MSDEYGPHNRYNRYDDEPETTLALEETNGQRNSRGRAVPPRARKLVQIVVNEVVLGEVDADELTAGAQFDLEDCASAHDLIRWLVQYAGGNEKEAIAALRPMKAQALIDLIVEASTAIGQAISVPKRSARR